MVVEGAVDVTGDSLREPDDAEDMAAGYGRKATGEAMRGGWPAETKRDVETIEELTGSGKGEEQES